MFSRVEALDSRHMGCRASYKRGTSKQHQRHIASYPRHVSLFAQGAALPKMGCRAASCIYSLVLWLRNLADSKEVFSALVDLGRLASNQNEAVTIVALHAARETLAIFTDSDAWNKEEQAVTRASLASITQIAQDAQAMLRENAALTPDQQSVDREIVENIQSALLRHIEATSMDKKTADVEKIFAWLQFSDPSVKVNNLLDERAHSTGSWFLDGKEFAAFKKGTHKVLWLHGKAGCGKSTMMAAAIQDLKAHAAVSDPPAVVLAHLLDTTNSSQLRDLRTLISSLLCQVAYSKAELATQLLKLRTWFSFGHSQTSLEAMSYGLDVMFDTPDLRFFVVIDALDEVEDEQISLFLQHLRTRANVSLRLSSRPEARFRDNAEGLCDARVSMDDSLVAGDIDIALRHVFHAGGALNEVLDSYMKDAISKAMIAQADGNFRWTRLQLLELVRVAGIPSKMLLSLSRLPETLDETYGRLLGRVLPEDQDDVRRLLIWAIFSHRPLSKTDFAQILSFDYSAPMPVYHASQSPWPTL
ncbi:hypothetical protein BD626DRAFT_615269 [Schizophyllum amplum]|uniref:Nephrocystin 3-like N-terminal domain-containing protein n=1 Tax=Schizophyllum amplum TaxID=97359 RepID=A0A550BXP8_9AGAR|nr:hypothetical protein BD626DRAFT_615269 [Auriculariopsis ampla]